MQSARAIDREIQEGLIIRETTGSHQRGIVPHLPIGHSLVERRNERDARLNDAIAHAAAERGYRRRWSAGLEEVERNDELKKPDRFQVCAEEWTRRPEHVVGVGIPQILLHMGVEQRGGQRAALDVIGHHANERGVHHALGQPHLVPVQSEAVV